MGIDNSPVLSVALGALGRNKSVAHFNGNSANYGILSNTAGYSTNTDVLMRQLAYAPQGISLGQLVYAGFVNTGTEQDTPINAGLTLYGMAIERQDGTIIPLMVKGALQPTLAPSQILYTDEAAWDVPAGYFWVRTWIHGTASQLPANFQVVSGALNGVSGALHEGIKNAPSTISDVVSDNAYPCFGPIAIIGQPLGKTPVASIALVGDSISQSSGDAYNLSPTYYPGSVVPGSADYANQCFVQKFAKMRVGVVPLNHSGYTLQKFAEGATALQRKALMVGTTHAFIQSNANDLNTARTSTQMLADLADVLAFAKGLGLKTIVTTAMPQPTTSSAAPSSVGAFLSGTGVTQNGVPAFEAQRLAYNAALRAGVANCDQLLDVDAFIVASGAAEGYWPVSAPVYTGTAVAATVTTSNNMSIIADPGLAAFANGALANPADGFGPYIVWIKSSTLGSTGLHGFVFDNSATGTVTVSQTTKSTKSFPPLFAGSDTLTYYIGDAWSYEGLHPFIRTHNRLAKYTFSQLQNFMGLAA